MTDQNVLAGHPPENAFPADRDEWQAILDTVAPAVRAEVATTVTRHAERCADIFYKTLLRHPDAATFLSHDVINVQLHHALTNWLRTLFPESAPDLDTLIRIQRHIGLVHARTRVPIHVILHGARLLKYELRHHLFARQLPPQTLSAAIDYTETMMDLAIEVMSQEYVLDLTKEIEDDEAYRLITLSQDVALERETQRGALLEWGQKAVLGIFGAATGPIQPLENAPFGLWLNHKGSLLFPANAGLRQIQSNVRHIDRTLLPGITAETPPSLGKVKDLQAALEEIRFLLDELFRKHEALENGRDPLTRVLSRRFLPSILGREVTSAFHRNTPFSLLLLDIDHFKTINDRFGHTSGDTVLRHIAELVVTCSRGNDFVFRYGGEEFLIALVETSGHDAEITAERLRARIEESPIPGLGDAPVRVTASIGVATFDGHPDYTHLIEDADRALYRAKSLGRNRWATA